MKIMTTLPRQDPDSININGFGLSPRRLHLAFMAEPGLKTQAYLQQLFQAFIADDLPVMALADALCSLVGDI